MIGGRGKLHMCRTTLFECYIPKFPEQFKLNRAELRFRGRYSVSARGGGCSVSVRSWGECSCSVSVSVSAEHKNCVRSQFGGPEPSRAPSTLGSFAGLGVYRLSQEKGDRIRNHLLTHHKDKNTFELMIRSMF